MPEPRLHVTLHRSLRDAFELSVARGETCETVGVLLRDRDGYVALLDLDPEYAHFGRSFGSVLAAARQRVGALLKARESKHRK